MFTVRRHKFNRDELFPGAAWEQRGGQRGVCALRLLLAVGRAAMRSRALRSLSFGNFV